MVLYLYCRIFALYRFRKFSKIERFLLGRYFTEKNNCKLLHIIPDSIRGAKKNKETIDTRIK